MLPTRVLYYGKDEPLPERIPLRAGPVSLVFENGDLRTVKLGGHEVLRRVYVAIRDRNWGTVAPEFAAMELEIGADRFRIAFDVVNQEGEIDFAWHGVIAGEPDGTITYTMDGAARATFMKNRIGFCVLLPAECAGSPGVVEHVDGTREQAELPVYIRADQPVVPFAELAAVAYQAAPGVWAEVNFSGDTFEMEDQRNWTDASYKIFSTPLRIPYPVELAAGTSVVQAVAIRIRDERLGAAGAGEGAEELAFGPVDGAEAVPLPPIGLGVASHGRPLGAQARELLAPLALDHLRVDLRLGDAGYSERLAAAAAEAAALGLPLHVGLFIDAEQADSQLKRFTELYEQVAPPVACWLLYSAQEVFWGGTPIEQVVEKAHAHLDGLVPGARFAAGTDGDFIFLQRNLPPLDRVDALTYAINPQVHAFDNASLTETLGTQAATVRSARRLARGLPVLVSPVTLKMRYNIYASTPAAPTPAGELPPNVDVRHMSLFGAGWTVASLKYLAEAGAASVTYYETTGWRGLVELAEGAPAPDKFQSLPGGVFPLYHVFADAGEFAGGQVLPSRSSDALRVDGLILRKGDAVCTLLANLTAEPQRVTVWGPSPRVHLRVLFETNVEAAMGAPGLFQTTAGTAFDSTAGTLTITLPPYAVARLDAA